MSVLRAESPPRRIATPVWARLLAVPVVVALTLLGLWFFAGVVTNDFRASMALTALWFAAGGAGAWLVSRRRPDLRLAVLGTYALTVALVGAFLAWMSFRDTKVDEQVARAGGGNVLVATGAFEGLAHPTSGTAAIVRVRGGERKLTLTGFETDPGPDLYVYLVPGRTSGESVDGGRSLGRLKGNVGSQQYDVPADFRADAATVVVWCRAFSVSFGAATLSSA